MSRSFTITNIQKPNGARVNYKDGRFLSATPAGAARKAFSRAYRMMRGTGPMTLNVMVQETTRGSAGKTFGYKVMRVAEKKTVMRDGVPVTYKFATKVKAM
jgi:hypothetical protein